MDIFFFNKPLGYGYDDGINSAIKVCQLVLLQYPFLIVQRDISRIGQNLRRLISIFTGPLTYRKELCSDFDYAFIIFRSNMLFVITF